MSDIDLEWLIDIDGLTVEGEVFGTIRVDGQDVQTALVRDRSGKAVALTFVPPGRHSLDETQRPPIWEREGAVLRDWADLSPQSRIVHIVINSDRIFVRAQIDGKWQSVALSALPDDLKFSETRRLSLRNVPPTMVIRDDAPVDTSDIPETDEEWFKNAKLRRPDEDPEG